MSISNRLGGSGRRIGSLYTGNVYLDILGDGLPLKGGMDVGDIAIGGSGIGGRVCGGVGLGCGCSVGCDFGLVAFIYHLVFPLPF